MQIKYLRIKRFKALKDIEIKDIETAFILVGQNSTGKTTVLDAIRLVSGSYELRAEDFDESGANIEVEVHLFIDDKDLRILQSNGKVSGYRKFESYKEEFLRVFPSYKDNLLKFTFVANMDGRKRYDDGEKKNNPLIAEIFPTIYYIDAERNLAQFQNSMMLLQEDDELKQMRANKCLFDSVKKCNHCFSCIGLIKKKMPEQLSAREASKLLDYKLYQVNLDSFAKKVNANYKKNGGMDEILYSMNRNVESMLDVTTEIYKPNEKVTRPIERLGKGMRSIYMLSLLETYTDDALQENCIIAMEEPEIFLHPSMQKKSGEILYRLSKKHQVIFSTHSPNLLSNFISKQIRQVVLDSDGNPTICENTNISAILDDLGYTANDLMNVNFVFIVEGKQDKSRLPLVLKKYYSEVYDENGKLNRIAIITTNSCTNIKTYANLKYMNQVYIKNQFLMIRDGDGKDSEELKHQLCKYYDEQNLSDVDHLPRVRPENVLVLKYYSFENYFLNPAIMKQVGVLENEEDFYEIFLEKWKDYLHRIKSARHLVEVIGHDITSVSDVKNHMEEIKIYLRGHNLYDIYYGRYKKNENEILSRYIELAPREDFSDILDSIDKFIFFESKKEN